MGILKTSILVACIIGIISCMVDIATPEGAIKRQLKVTTSIILILAVFLPFIGNSPDLDFDEFHSLVDDGTYGQMSEDFMEMYSGMATEEMEEAIGELIGNEGIDIVNVVIESGYDEYNSLEANKVIITAIAFEDKDKEVVREIITQRLPDTEIEFKVSGNDGY